MVISTTSLKRFLSKQSLIKLFSITGILAFSVLFAACSSSDDDDKRPEIEDGKSVVIKDLAGDLETSMGTAQAPPDKIKGTFKLFLFNFKNKRQFKEGEDKEEWEKLQKSTKWDIAFTGPYNAEIYINNATQEKSPGFGGAATNTAVLLVKDDYQNVKMAPTDDDFDKSKVSLIGWSAIEKDHGWFQYDEGSHIMKALPNRTYVLRLSNGKYAKLQIINAYKGNPPAITNLNWPAPYYTFRYFVQEDGSKNLKTD